ncbi:dehydrogenase [Candidatus Bathyarchaeota archaeon ex4484_205]|nr:MAG: dehydrogenase [Candidatus Bathyarchaeota archaeon ex4484_205]
MMNDPLKIGIVSFAHMHAWSYLRTLSEIEEGELSAIFEEDPERRRALESRFPDIAIYSDLREMLAREKLDAVIITSENARHISHAREAMLRGLHIMVEKPITTRLEDADEILSLAEREDLIVQTAFPMRYHDATVIVRDLIERGSIGEILVITATNHGRYPGGWFGVKELSGGGAMMDHTVHTADLMRWYTGDEVKKVYAVRGRNIRENLEVDDIGLISLTFNGGVIGSIDCSWSRPSTYPIWGDVWLLVIGTKGCIYVDAFASRVESVIEGDRLRWKYSGADADKAMIWDFIRCVEEGRRPRADGFDGRQALEITLAAYKSVEGGGVVQLPLGK